LVTAAIDIIGGIAGSPPVGALPDAAGGRRRRRARAGAANLRPRARYVGASRPRVIPLVGRLHRKARSRNASGANQDLLNPLRGSEGHRHKEAVHARLAAGPVIPVEDPVISILAG